MKNTPLVFSTVNGNQIAIADVDVDANNSRLQVNLAATNGTVALNGSVRRAVTGDGTANVSLTGTIANINNALNGLRFDPSTTFNGNASLKIVTNDQGNTGAGGTLSDTDTINITVNAVSSVAPVLADIAVTLNSVNEEAGIPIGVVGFGSVQTCLMRSWLLAPATRGRSHPGWSMVAIRCGRPGATSNGWNGARRFLS